MSLRYPPLGSFGKTVLRFLLNSGTGYNRPVSVEGERWRIKRQRMRRMLVGVMVVVLGGWLGVAARRR